MHTLSPSVITPKTSSSSQHICLTPRCPLGRNSNDSFHCALSKSDSKDSVRSALTYRGKSRCTYNKNDPYCLQQTTTNTPLADSSVNSEENVQVILRMRPLSKAERANPKNRKEAWEVTDEGLLNKVNNKLWKLDRVFDEFNTNQDLFDETLEPVIWQAMEGYNEEIASIFCYGQTGSGKTYTMYGTSNENPGVVQLAVDTIFSYIEATPEREYLLRFSFIEIYNESINDLLDPSKMNLQIRDHIKIGMQVKGLTEFVCTKVDQVMGLLQKGEKNRKIGATNLNEKSSRSHTILRVTIESKQRNKDSAKPIDDASCSGPVYSSALNLIDLAGSENANATNCTSKKEMSFINKSLLTLGIIIQRLSERKSKIWLPYRDSKLTRYMQTALEGNSKIAIICTISPARNCYEETLCTLGFAIRAKNITQCVRRNEVMDDKAVIYSYERKIKALEGKLREMELHSQCGKYEPVASEEAEAKLQQKIKELDTLLAKVTEEKYMLLDEINTLRSMILVSGEIAGNSDADQLQDLTDEMENKLKMSLSMEKRYNRIKESRGGLSRSSSVYNTRRKTKAQAESDLNKEEEKQLITIHDKSSLLSEASEKDHTFFSYARKSIENFLAKTALPTETKKDKEAEIRETLENSEKEFMNEMTHEYQKHVKAITQKMIELTKVKKFLLSKNEQLTEKLMAKEIELESVVAKIDMYKAKYGLF